MDDRAANNRAIEHRRPYTKPQIQEVALRPEEAVLGNCKTSSLSGAAQSLCTFPITCSGTTS